jgi:hypothetical protein
MVPITYIFFHYMVSLPDAVKAEIGRRGSEKRDYRHHARTGCDDNRWLSTGWMEEERQLAYPIRDLHFSTKNYPSSPLEISSIHVAVVSLSCTLRS